MDEFVNSTIGNCRNSLRQSTGHPSVAWIQRNEPYEAVIFTVSFNVTNLIR